MATDRELLELAAKAAGIDAAWLCPADEIDEHAGHLAETEGMWLKGARGPSNSAYWNPLADDGDAFHLLVRRGMRVHVDLEEGCTRIFNEFDGLILRQMHFAEGPEAATRRAIVRAVAMEGTQ